MLKQITIVGLLALSTPLAAQDASTVVATVGDTPITLGEMIQTRANLPQEYANLPDEVLFQGILDQLIQQQLLADDVDEVPPGVSYALSNEERTLLAGVTINQIALAAVTEESINAAFAAMTDGAGPETEWNASHLLVATPEEAAAARARVVAGEEFAAVARDVSTGPSGPSGGELGWFSTGMMVKPFEDAVKTLDVGGLSEPVQTDFGWHIIKLNDSRTIPLPELEEIRPQLIQQVQREAIDARIAELRALATITLPPADAFDPTLISKTDLLEMQ